MTSRRRLRGDRGVAEVLGLVLIVPVALGLAVLVIFLGRQVDSRAQVHTAAEAAAQAAAQERTPGAATAAARAVVGAMLVDPSTCRDPSLAVATSRFGPGGDVSVTVTCHVSASGLELIEPPERSFTVTATATIDPYRAAAVVP